MKRYVIHLKVEYYEPEKKDKKNDLEAGRKSNEDAAKKVFALALGTRFKNKEAVLIKDEYAGPTFSTAVWIDIQNDKIDEVLSALRLIDVVDIMEPDYARDS